MTDLLRHAAIGRPLARIDGPAKVTGSAPYAYEQPVESPLYLHPIQATVARGRVRAFDSSPATGTEGVVAVLTHHNAARLSGRADGELAMYTRPLDIAGLLATLDDE